MTENILFHFLLYKFVPDINTYENYLKSKKEFIFNPDGIANKDFINCHFVDSFLYNDNRFKCLTNIHNNGFITQEKKDNFSYYFNVTQRYYYKFKKLYNIYCSKKLKIYDNDVDLCLMPLDSYKNNISITQQNTKYIFKINDIIRIITEGLLFHYEMFLEPKKAKNPYNNIEFSLCDLYNIYLHIIIKTKINPPILLTAYFKSEFNIKNFVLNNEALLKDLAINNHYNEIQDNEECMCEHLLNMIEKTAVINIHDNFPSDKIVDNLKHCLNDYLISEFSYNPTKRKMHKKLLYKKINEFHKASPRFGRIYHRSRARARISSIPSFETISDQRWMSMTTENRRTILNTISNSMINNNIVIRNDNNNIHNNSISTSVNTSDNNETDSDDEVSVHDVVTDVVTDINTNINTNIDSDDEFERESTTTDTDNNLQTTSIIDSSSYVSTLYRSNEQIFNNDNLITSSTDDLFNNFVFNDDLQPIITENTFHNVISTDNLFLNSSNYEINELQNNPYDAVMGPFSPFSSSNSSHSISPSTRNLNILNETTFNINIDGSNDSDNDTN